MQNHNKIKLIKYFENETLIISLLSKIKEDAVFEAQILNIVFRLMIVVINHLEFGNLGTYFTILFI